MPIALDEHATEESTYIIEIKFYDEEGSLVVPTSIKWTLTDKAGTTVNSREDEPITPPASTVNIVLSGDDLAVGVYTSLRRYLLIEAVYDSTFGNDLPLKDEATFVIDGLIDLPDEEA